MAITTDNTQESRQFNPTSGEYNYLTKTGNFTLSQDNEQVAIPNGSSLMVVDLGVTIDRSDAQITVGGNVLEVLYFVSKSDLVGVELGTGKCAILTEEPNFRTVIYLDIAQLNKSMSYQVSSLNNSLPSYELNDIARQLNSIGGDPIIPDTGNVLDGGTADFRVILTNTNTTRTLANGEVLGQTATLFNATANTIIVTSTGGNFTLTPQRNFTKLIWDGSKWLRGVEIPVGATVWLDSNINPISEFGGAWSSIGSTGEYLAINTSGGGGTATENLPDTGGSFTLRNANVESDPIVANASGAFEVGGNTGADVANIGIIASYRSNARQINYSASRSNSKYTSTNTVRPQTRYVKGWKKTAY